MNFRRPIPDRPPNRGQLRAHSTSGFTLIELLVVLAIISVLFGLLTTALARARAVAKQTVCQSRLRQWGLAFAAYAGENDAYYPHIDGLDRQADATPDTPADRADYFGWVDLLPPVMNQTPFRDHSPWNYPGPGTFFQCPAAKLADRFDPLADDSPRRGTGSHPLHLPPPARWERGSRDPRATSPRSRVVGGRRDPRG